jgi:CSLREA domain-containing protein
MSTRRNLLALAVAQSMAGGAFANQINVDSTLDQAVDRRATKGDVCTLREAIVAANTDTNFGGCEMGDGDDIIVFAPALLGSTVTLTAGPLNLYSNVHIQGPGPIISANNNSRVLDVDGPSNVIIEGLTLQDGSSANGGAIANNGTLTLLNSTVTASSATSDGGAVYNGGSMTLYGSTISGNQSSVSGGAVINWGTLTLMNGSFISDNIAAGGRGGGVINNGMMVIRDSVVNYNTASQFGGGIFNGSQSSISANRAFIRSNSASGGGAGIYNSGSAELNDVTLSANLVTVSGATGGTITSTGTLTLNRTTISGNTALGSGVALTQLGGSSTLDSSVIHGNTGDLDVIHVLFGQITLENSTISGNASGYSGGLALLDGASASIRNSTFSDNGSLNRPTLYVGAGSTASLVNSIVANTGDGDDCGNAGLLEVNRNNIIETQSASSPCADNAENLISGQDPLLGPLVDNGGPTPTHAIDNTSPAYQAGSTAAGDCPDYDQRGFPRQLDGACSIGAFEASSAIIVTTLSDESTGNGECSLREAIANANEDALPPSVDCNDGDASPDIIGFASDLRGGTIDLTLGELVVSDSLTIEGPGADQLTIDAGGNFRIFHFVDLPSFNSFLATNNVLRGLTLTGGNSNGPGSTDPAGRGGAIRSVANLTIEDSTISGNTATLDGGGLWFRFGTLDVNHSTLSTNYAVSKGGGLYTRNAESSLSNVTLSGNTANSRGGGIYIDSGPVTLSNTTLVGNLPASIRSNAGETASLVNSVIAGGTPDLEGNFSAPASLIQDPGGATVTGSPITGVDPELAPLANNGGTTLTHAPLEGSPLIDAGNNGSCEADDQNGTARPIDGLLDGQAVCDIGSVEVIPERIFLDGFEGP